MRPVGQPSRHAESPGQFLRRLFAENGGSVPVERFLREALYHPQHGYYSRRVRTVGREGDFSTSATLHGALGRAIAAWAASHRRSVTNRGRWHLIELGGGTGELAAEIQRSLGWFGRIGLHYHLVEVSETLRTEQQQRLARWHNVRWHTEIDAALEAADRCAHIFSNEFVDAFPCLQLMLDPASEQWREVFVAWPEESEHPVEILRDCNHAPPGGSQPYAPGQRVEVHSAYERWLAKWLPHWKRGRLLTIDYGDIWPDLYYRRPHGTLRAYCRHQRFNGLEVYQRFGQQDLTADVNFTDLRGWGEALGLVTDRYDTQAEFLRRWLPRRWLQRESGTPALAFLLDPSGAGSAFKVLEQFCPQDQKAA